MAEGRVFRVVREPGDKRTVAELVAEQCDGAVPTKSDKIILREIIDERLNDPKKAPPERGEVLRNFNIRYAQPGGRSERPRHDPLSK